MFVVHRKKRRAVLATALVSVVSFGTGTAMAGTSPAKAAGKSVYTKSVVTDLATGKSFDMAKLASAKKPTLMFIWAPS